MSSTTSASAASYARLNAEKERRERALYEQAPVAYLVLRQDSAILDINAAGARLLGWPREWLLGKPLARWIVREDRRALAEHLAAAAAEGEALGVALRLKQRSGRRTDVQLHTSGAGHERLTVMLDVSEARQAQREGREMQEQLAHLMRLETVGHIASSLAHDLNQPLGTVVLNCDSVLVALRAEPSTPPEVIEALAQAAEAASYAADIVRQLRRLVRGDSAEHGPVELRPLVERSLQLVAAAARDAEAEVEVALPAALPPVLASSVQVEQVLVNLLSNSFEAMVRGGCAERRVRVSAVDTPAAVRVTLRDTGPGLDRKSAQIAFLPFHSGKPGGMGMGLPVSRSIIEAHGGRLWAEPGLEGATLHFTLPLAAHSTSLAR